MRALITIGILAWFAAWAFAGYALTGKSFAWVGAPHASSAKPVAPTSAATTTLAFPTTREGAIRMYANLTTTQRQCLIRAMTPEQLATIQQGNTPTPSDSQMIAIRACLQ